MSRLKKMITEKPRHKSWLNAVVEAAKEEGSPLPSFTEQGMGSASTECISNGRFITFKCRLVSQVQAQIDGIEWTLWRNEDGLPIPVAAFREPLEPTNEKVVVALSIFKGWLVDGWTSDTAKAVVCKHPRATLVLTAEIPNVESVD